MSVSLRITTLAAAALLAASLTGGTAALASVTAPHRITPDTITGTETGQGATLQKAVHQASAQMNDDYNGCVQPFNLAADGQYANGTWWVILTADCQGSN